MRLTIDQMRDAGRIVKNLSFTNEEISTSIKAIDMMIAYLEQSGDSRAMISTLVRRRMAFEDFQQARKSKCYKE